MRWHNTRKYLRHKVFSMKHIFLACFSMLMTIAAVCQRNVSFPQIGVVQAMENDSLIQAFGYHYLVEATPKLLSPRNVSDQQFQRNLEVFKNLHVPLFACNLFIPGDLKVVGPMVDEQAVLTYADLVLQRAKAANLKMIIWGSGASRSIPEGFDRAKAKDQFVSIAKKIGGLAAKHNITIAIENLNITEVNFINTVGENLEIVKAVDHPNIRMCIDIYHMLKENESPDIITQTKKYVVYCEVAEKEGRTPPGVHGDDFTPYFAALKKIGYHGNIVIECRWEDFSKQGNAAYQALRKQVDAIYKN